MERQSGWKRRSKEEIEEIFAFCEGYKRFLDRAKTEREAVVEVEKTLVEHGFATDLKGPKVYRINRGKEVVAYRRGGRDIADGMRIIIAHIDAPRLDLKQNPLYEEVDLALLRTHYYGGIKKYQWLAMPLAIHGVVVKMDGTTVELVLGEDEERSGLFDRRSSASSFPEASRRKETLGSDRRRETHHPLRQHAAPR